MNLLRTCQVYLLLDIQNSISLCQHLTHSFGSALDSFLYLAGCVLLGRCTTNRGSYTSVGPCKMVCKWDNNFSWMNGKNIKYMISAFKIELEGAEGINL